MKVAYGGKVHLAEARYAAGWARLVCNAIVLPSFTWEAETDDTTLTCRDCIAAESRAAEEMKGELGCP